MSLQKGNVRRQRGQKHQNSTAFKNSMHDTSQLTQKLNSLEIHGVCERCRDIIQWKIKYKKYKPLSAPGVCSQCRERTVKAAYRRVCSGCAEKLGCCQKCGESSVSVIARDRPSQTDRDRWAALVRREVRGLPERYRRSLIRLVEASSWSTLEELEELRKRFQERLLEVRALLDDQASGDGASSGEEEEDGETDDSENTQSDE